jgi:hypothetical protein
MYPEIPVNVNDYCRVLPDASRADNGYEPSVGGLWRTLTTLKVVPTAGTTLPCHVIDVVTYSGAQQNNIPRFCTPIPLPPLPHFKTALSQIGSTKSRLIAEYLQPARPCIAAIT